MTAGLQMASEVKFDLIWNQKPHLSWEYSPKQPFWWPLRPWQPPNGLWPQIWIKVSNLDHPGIHVHIELAATKWPWWPQGSNLTSDLKLATSITPGFIRSMCISHLTAKRPQWPRGSNLTSDFKSATMITLVSMCILHPTAILMTSQAMTASKWPQESNLTLDLK